MMSATLHADRAFDRQLRGASARLTWLGVAMVVLGVAAIVFPMVSTLAVTLFVGWSLLLFGALSLAFSFSIVGAGPFFGALLFSLASIAVGIFLLFNPAAGAVSLTLLAGLIFVLQGAFETFFALETRPNSGWVAMLISAIASIVLAVVIFSGWPQISGIVLGILFGVNFISSGLGYIFVSRALKS